MIEIIKRARRYADPYIQPIYGSHGPCALCRSYAKLTEDHIPPAATGNVDRWIARSYLSASTVNEDIYFGRSFRGGVKFRTLCKDCNNGLGANEDKEIASLFDKVRKVVETPLVLSPLVRIACRPNLVFRGLLAHLIAANDSGIPSAFDEEGREIFFRRRDIRSTAWSLFYWLYEDKRLFVMRNAYHAVWHPTVEVRPLQILKIYPLAFMFVQEPLFYGLPNMRAFLQQQDEAEIDVPLWLYRRDRSPIWPAVTARNNLMLLGGNSFGLVARRD